MAKKKGKERPTVTSTRYVLGGSKPAAMTGKIRDFKKTKTAKVPERLGKEKTTMVYSDKTMSKLKQEAGKRKVAKISSKAYKAKDKRK